MTELNHTHVPPAIWARVCELVGKDEAAAWLATPALGLGGRVPLELLRDEGGVQQLMDLLNRLDYGAYT